MFAKESVSPALMIAPAPPATAPRMATQNTAQAHPDPAVHGREGCKMTVFEIFKPAAQHAIDFLDDRLQAVTVIALGHNPDCILELAEALLTRPTHAAFKVVSQKIESSFLGGIDNPCLVWMQLQSYFRSPLQHLIKRFFGICLALAQNHKIVCVSHQVDLRLLASRRCLWVSIPQTRFQAVER